MEKSKRTDHRGWIRGAFAILMLTFASAAHAQEVQPDTVPVPLPEVVVNILRTPFSALEVPYAVAVTTRDEIQRAKPGLGLDEALVAVPGVQVDNRFNYALGERISIRGFGARAQFGVRGVKVLLDGIPATLPDGQTTLNQVDLSALGRAEVIRGPASALYGNAAGGVLQLETELPPPTPLTQEVGVVAGSDKLLRIHSTTGGQSGDASYLLNLSRLTYDGYRDFSAAENLHLNAKLGVRRADNEFRLIANFVDYDARNPGSLSDSLLRADRTQAFGFNRLQQTGEEGRQGQLGGSFRGTFAFGETELSGYALTRRIDNPIPPRIIGLERVAGGVRALLRTRLDPGTQRVQLTVGAESDLQRDDRENFDNERGERGDLLLDQRERVAGIGTFAQLSIQPLQRLNLLAGVRYDRITFEVTDRLVSSTNPDDSGERSMDAVSPSIGINYAVAEPLHLYANFASSFETPTTTELANRPSGAGGFNPELQPQRARSYEVGAKGRLGRRATYEVAAYRARIEDELISFEVPDVPGRQFFRNAGSAVHRGFEAASRIALVPDLIARTAYTYTDAVFDDYSTADASFDDNRVPGIAPHRLDVSISYDAPAGWFAGTETRVVSRTPVDDANQAYSSAYTVTDVRAGIEALRFGRIELAPFAGVTNLFDREYNTSVVINAFGARFFEPGPPRSFYVGLQAVFGQPSAAND